MVVWMLLGQFFALYASVLKVSSEIHRTQLCGCGRGLFVLRIREIEWLNNILGKLGLTDRQYQIT